ncbi:radical SAM protein [Candidatus Oscillochloris fontis]|uniref:radical SAM protein n=1 Tax=Candidatus Oscillochloris fontis TaxID=2496868 RepID=UPI003B83615E
MTGGEPFVYKDLFQLLKIIAAKRERYSFALLSNGTLIDATLTQRLQALHPRFVQVSIEGTPS